MPNVHMDFLQTYVDTDVLTLARERVSHLFDRFDTVSVSFSGGKDSTVALNLCAEEAIGRGRGLHVQFHDEEVIPMEAEEYVRRCWHRLQREVTGGVELEWVCLPLAYHNACSRTEPWWYPWDPTRPERWVRQLPAEALTEHPTFRWGQNIMRGDWAEGCYDVARLGSVAVVLGIRCEESMVRKHAILSKLNDSWIIPPTNKKLGQGIVRAYPIYDWLTPDVWKAIHDHAWDYCTVYDLMYRFGLSGFDQRLAPPFHQEGQVELTRWAALYPEMWDKLLDRVAGARTAALYAGTEVYGMGGVPPLGPGETWMGRLEQEVSRWGDELRYQVADAVRFYVDHHYKHTHDPILDVPHPRSGVSWPFLVKVAIRGDLKHRMRPMLTAARIKAEQHSDRYTTALAAWRQEGQKVGA